MISDLVPHLGGLVDDFAFVHSLTSKTNTHGPAENFLSTGFVPDGFPSIGAWVTYALGSEDQDLPAFVAIPDPRGVPQASVNNWGPGFLPVQILRFDPSSRKLDPWRTIDPLDPAGILGMSRVSLARNGEVCAYQVYRLLSDLYVIENLR